MASVQFAPSTEQFCKKIFHGVDTKPSCSGWKSNTFRSLVHVLFKICRNVKKELNVQGDPLPVSTKYEKLSDNYLKLMIARRFMRRGNTSDHSLRIIWNTEDMTMLKTRRNGSTGESTPLKPLVLCINENPIPSQAVGRSVPLVDESQPYPYQDLLEVKNIKDNWSTENLVAISG